MSILSSGARFPDRAPAFCPDCHDRAGPRTVCDQTDLQDLAIDELTASRCRNAASRCLAEGTGNVRVDASIQAAILENRP